MVVNSGSQYVDTTLQTICTVQNVDGCGWQNVKIRRVASLFSC